MSDSEDMKNIVAQVSSDLITRCFNCILDGAQKNMRAAWLRMTEDFSTYVERVHRKNSSVRLICSKEKDTPIYDIYVGSNFSCQGSTITDDDLVYRIREGGKIIVTGIGGSGKTLFMKHVWMSIFANPIDQIPIFVELRSIDSITSGSLMTLIRLSLSSSGSLPDDVFRYFCKIGRFCFILDGLDEVNEAKRDDLADEIILMSDLYPYCPFVISSRPDRMFSGWQNFEQFSANPFCYRQTKNLLSKIPFDEEDRRLFFERMTPAYFDKNKSFLSNPLLSIMMMMTFKDHMNIPEKLNIFYDAAYMTLFTWHDATKRYKRQRTMDIDECQRVFGIFCLISYCDEIFEFTETQINEYIIKSINVLGYNFSVTGVIQDFTESVNLMIQDGIKYIFVHRSFQEYFSAYALTKIIRDHAEDFMPRLMTRQSDNLLKMAYEFYEELMIRYYVRPYYEQYIKNVTKTFNPARPFRVMMELKFPFAFVIHPFGGEVKMGIRFSSDALNFCYALPKNIGVKDGEKYLDDMDHTKILLKLFDCVSGDVPIRKRPNDDIIMEIGIKFTEKDLHLNIISTENVSHKEIGAMISHLGEHIDEFVPIFVEFGRELCRFIAIVKGMCENCFQRSEKKGQSLSVILASIKAQQ